MGAVVAIDGNPESGHIVLKGLFVPNDVFEVWLNLLL